MRKSNRSLLYPMSVLITVVAVLSCIISISFLLWGLIHEGPAFYNGQECRMTYSHFQFLPLRVLQPPQSPSSTRPTHYDERYRLLKFTDARDPRHKHFYPISGGMVENYESQSNPKKMKRKGRLLDMDDNWCLLSDDIILEKERGGSNTYNNGTQYKKLRSVPHPHKGHPVLYVPGHWGSFSQSRSMGAHGTRWTGPYGEGKSDQEIYESLLTGEGMHDGRHLGMMMDLHDDKNTTHQTSEKELMEWWFSSSPSQLFQKQQYLDTPP